MRRDNNVKVISTATAVSLLAKDSYQLAVLAGFKGTLIQWLDTLKPRDGYNGRDGLSAYEIALKHGFVGTEEEWLKSLKGADGSTGSLAIPPHNFLNDYILART